MPPPDVEQCFSLESLRNSLDRTTECGASTLGDWLARDHFIQRVTKIVGSDAFDLLRVVDAAVINKLHAGVQHVDFRSSGGSQPVRNLITFILKNGEGQMLLGR